MLRAFLNVLFPALQIQMVIGLGMGLSALVSFFYWFLEDPRYPQEHPEILLIGTAIGLGCFLVGQWGAKKLKTDYEIHFAQGAWIVLLTWIISCSISALVFVLSGFPIPEKIAEFDLLRRFIDGFYESMSGFTTTGTSVLPSVEAFPRSILFWRSLTHWIGGMGIAYMAVTIWKYFTARRTEVINSETESPHIILYKNEDEAILSGKDFLKAYGVLSLVCALLLLISGYFFRQLPYLHWYDNLFDSLTIMFGTLGTGGFSVYNSSIGLSITEHGQTIIGALRNPASEWIIAFFMLFSGMNFGLWYIFLFNKKIKEVFRNREFQAYWIFIIGVTLAIAYLLIQSGIHTHIWESLRYSLFNVATILSTTGYANDDFAMWPVGAQGLLFICYLLGACVGSTGGGLKFTRFLVFFRYAWMQAKNLVRGSHESSFTIDGIRYDEKSSGMTIVTMLIYYILFFLGAIAILLTSSKAVFSDGSLRELDFMSGFTASIANLGNIGPAIVNGTVGDGPTGNYFAFSALAKVIMIGLMYLGRVGVLSIVVFFMKKEAEDEIAASSSTITFDSDAPLVFGR